MANDICIRETLSGLKFLLAEEQEVFVIYDENASWVAQEVVEAIRKADGPTAVRSCIGLETSEEEKTMETVLALERQLLEADATRGALLVAVGGGITTDLVGFTAAIYKRGVRYANVPTTLLAMVDASIGGKTGVNLDDYKNMLGAFRMPEFTYLCPEPLRTLPERECKAGLAEMLKTFLLADGPLYGEAVRFFATAQNDRGAGAKMAQNAPGTAEMATCGAKMAQNAPGTAEMAACGAKMAQNAPGTAEMATCGAKSAPNAPGVQRFIEAAARIKAQIVERDPLEGGERAKLNLGHTFGHAIEHEAREKGADITHGEAVAMGILLAARVSEGAGIAPKGLADRLARDFAAIGLPTESPFPMEDLVAAMHKDKKATGRQVKCVLPEAPGKVSLQEMTPEQAYDCYLAAK